MTIDIERLRKDSPCRPFTLYASGLASKWGNGDGDALDDYLNDHLDLFVSWGDNCPKYVQHLLIEKHIVPLILGLVIEHRDGLHNASRATDECKHLVENSEVSVDLDAEYILEYIKPYVTQITPYGDL